MIRSQIELNHSVAVAIVRTISNQDWEGKSLYSESNAADYYNGEASVLSSELSPVPTKDIPERGEMLKLESETLYIDEKNNHRFIVTLRKFHYATTMTVERVKYE